MFQKFVGSFTGAVATAFGSSICCAGPTVAASMGLSTAGLSAFLPYRPLFIAAAAGFTYYAYHLYDKAREPGNEEGEVCDVETRRRMKKILWASTALVLLFAFSPVWIHWVL